MVKSGMHNYSRSRVGNVRSLKSLVTFNLKQFKTFETFDGSAVGCDDCGFYWTSCVGELSISRPTSGRTDWYVE